MLYDSDSFVVLHVSADAPLSPEGAAWLRHDGFEIVDKHAGKEVFLDGAWAELFQAEIATWGDEGIGQEEIEATLERYAALAQNPVIPH